jgi:tetratricopeptide (TPR) repeat protein
MTGSTGAARSIDPASAEGMFRLGLAHLGRRAHQEAAACFQRAVDLDREAPSASTRMRYISFLGLAVSMLDGRSNEAVELCRRAVKRQFYDPDLLCNLGIVYLRQRQRGPAFHCFERGLKLRPNHPRILAELGRHASRGRPMFGFLPRDHTVNRLAGLLRFRLIDLFDRGAA